MRTLKGYVRNKARPEGSIAEGYISEEAMTLVSRYLDETTINSQNSDDVDKESTLSIFKVGGQFISRGEYKELDILEHTEAQFYVLKNCEEVQPWVDEHITELSRQNSRNLEKRHKEQFVKWFEKQVVISLSDSLSILQIIS